MKPVLQALVLADKVYDDKATSKKVIAGTFNQIYFFNAPAPQQPGDDGFVVQPVHRVHRSGSPTLYVNLTEVRGMTPLEIRYVSLRDSRVLFRIELVVEGKNPLDSCEVILPLPELPRPHEGVYAIELLHDDELIGAHRVRAVEIANEHEGDES